MPFDFGTTTSATANSGTLTLEGLLENIERAACEVERMSREHELRAIPAFVGAGLRVYESLYATSTEPARTHKKRRNQSEAYHRRIQKKWVKRYGTKQVPCAYVIDNAALGGYGRSLVAHPHHLAVLRNLPA